VALPLDAADTWHRDGGGWGHASPPHSRAGACRAFHAEICGRFQSPGPVLKWSYSNGKGNVFVLFYPDQIWLELGLARLSLHLFFFLFLRDDLGLARRCRCGLGSKHEFLSGSNPCVESTFNFPDFPRSAAMDSRSILPSQISSCFRALR
jgi:hypothetical protein